MRQRGWTVEQIEEAIRTGKGFKAKNSIHPENSATRHVHPKSGRSVVVDDLTGDVIHLGGDGFVY